MSFPARLLNHTVTVLAQVDSAGLDLEPLRTYEARAGLAGVPARVVEFSGKDLALYEKAGREVTAVIYFAGAPEIAPSDHIQWGAKVFEVLNAIDPHGLGHHTEVECKARIG